MQSLAIVLMRHGDNRVGRRDDHLCADRPHERFKKRLAQVRHIAGKQQDWRSGKRAHQSQQSCDGPRRVRGVRHALHAPDRRRQVEWRVADERALNTT